MQKNLLFANGKRKMLIEKELLKVIRNPKIGELIFRMKVFNGEKNIAYLADKNGIKELKNEKPYSIASVTKLFIATVILKLKEENKLKLTDKLTAYFTEDEISGLVVFKKVDYSKEVTIYNLLTHSSGIREYLEIKDANNKSIVDDIIINPNKTWTIKEIITIVRNGGEGYFKPQNVPSKKYQARYSDTNFQLLIEIMRRIEKKSYEDIIEEKILRPCGMKNTYLPTKRDVDSYPIYLGKDELKTNTEALKALGDFNSTTSDLILFFENLLNNECFSNKDTLEIMMGSFQTFKFGVSLLSPGWPIQYGVGIMRFKMPKFLSPFKEPVELIGHTGASGAWLFYEPKQKMIYVGTSNQVAAAALPFKLMPKIVNISKK